MDLHVHTKYSDGNLSLEDILKLASKLEIEEISITDHETIINLDDYEKLEKKYKIKIIPGIEIPANYSGMHILGYGIENFKLVEKRMYDLKLYNENCNRETIDILKSEGIDINFEVVKKNATLDVVTYRDIVKYMVKKGFVKEPLEAYRKYIGKGTKAYVPSKSLSMEEVLSLIKEGKGISVLAHPFTLKQDTDYDILISKMKYHGLDGIEIYPLRLTSEQNEKYNIICQKFKLVKTIGTDFHNSNTDKLGIEVDDSYLSDFHNKILKKERRLYDKRK